MDPQVRGSLAQAAQSKIFRETLPFGSFACRSLARYSAFSLFCFRRIGYEPSFGAFVSALERYLPFSGTMPCCLYSLPDNGDERSGLCSD
jgi:hypothetical protein